MFGGDHTTRFWRATVLAMLVSLVVGGVGTTASAGTATDDESVLGQGGGSLILVLDGSGSMKESAGDGRTRMEAAKDGLNGVIDKLPQDSKAGLRVYGSTIEDGQGSCTDSELLAPVEDVDAGALKAGVNKLKPLGNTPIAYSLKKAYADLPSKGPRSIVLVSDGEENCGGDPCKVARDLKKKGADFYVDVVGLQLKGKSRNQMTCIASAGGGTYYDVKDLKQLTSTLTRTSVRAARGYEPAGLPIEGGTSVEQGAKADDGQWLDTIGDTGEEFYELPDPGKGTLHVSASTPPSLRSDTAAERLEVDVLSGDGTECGPGAKGFVQGASNAGSPLVVGYSATPELRKSCGDGPYLARVTAPDVQDVQPLEVLVRSEPAVTTTKGLPPGFTDGSGFSDDTEGQSPSGEPVSVVGGPNFSSAPPTEPGRYADAILAGETLFYRVPDVAWGQQAICDFTLGSASQAEGALGDPGFFMPMRSRIFGPLKAPVVDTTSTKNTARYNGSDDATMHVATPPVAYLNRESTQEAPKASSLDGDFYCSVTALAISNANPDAVGEIPVTLDVSITGEATGEPEYASEPKEPANDQQADDSGLGWPWILGGLVVLAALAAGLLAALRRRRGQGAAESAPSPGEVDAGPGT